MDKFLLAEVRTDTERALDELGGDDKLIASMHYGIGTNKRSVTMSAKILNKPISEIMTAITDRINLLLRNRLSQSKGVSLTDTEDTNANI